MIRKKKIIFIAIIILTIPLGLQIIISTTAENQIEYWAFCIDWFGQNCTLAMKNALVENGWNEKHILTMEGEELTEDDFLSGISWLEKHDDSNDIVLIYTCSHGSQEGLWYNNKISYVEINEAINKLDSKGVAIFITACHSGSAISYLKKEGRVIITSCESDTVSGGPFDYLVYHGIAGLADYMADNNGIVSAEEIYSYIDANQYGAHIPQIQDDYHGSLNLAFLSVENRNPDQMQIIQNEYFGCDYCSFAPYQLIAQSFIPSKTHLDKVKLIVDNYQSAKCPLTVSIKKDLYEDELTSVTIEADQIINALGGLVVEFDFEDITVTTGETYYIVCKVEAVEGIEWEPYHFRGDEIDDEDFYKNGKLFSSFDSGLTWDIYDDGSDYDLVFVTYGYDTNNASFDLNDADNPSSNSNIILFYAVIVVIFLIGTIAIVLIVVKQR